MFLFIFSFDVIVPLNLRTIVRTKEITHAYPSLTPPLRPTGVERSFFHYFCKKLPDPFHLILAQFFH